MIKKAFKSYFCRAIDAVNMIRFKKLYLIVFCILKNIFISKKVNYITDIGWAIQENGKNLKKEMKELNITFTSLGIRNSIIHYGFIGLFMRQDKIKLPHKSNKIIVTWYHVLPNENRYELVKEAVRHVDAWHTSSKVTQNKMIELGIPKEKIILIPLGVDFDYFNTSNIKHSKENLSIPANKIVIGYFQKDGIGWGEGNEPKLIKGPDIFCDVVLRLSKKYDIFILLTGPARGYVKNYLQKENIAYSHEYLEDPNKVANYYKASDLYLITSRVEGGPMSILESMACGVPLISTKVGMAEDIIIDGQNGYLVDIEDVDTIYNRACTLIENKELRLKFINSGLKTVINYDWLNIANQYYEKIYNTKMPDGTKFFK